jgi:CubicO group peptidase (beta-lactamase class C family)
MASYALLSDGLFVAGEGHDIEVPWWSFTKTVLAAGALVLVRDGRLALDEPLRDRPYTLRQLLQHRAGVANYGALSAYHDAVARNEDAWPVADLLARCHADQLLFAPGTGWTYSNIGYFQVRELIERTTQSRLDEALDRLVLRPLGVAGVRLSVDRKDFRNAYDPRWVYHGLLMGSLRQAALLLQSLLAGNLLPSPLLSAMLDRYPVGGSIADRPWKAPGYGLGLMMGYTHGDALIAGHTGGGPGSVIAVYQRLDAGRRCTAATFEAGGTEGVVESACSDMLEQP